MPEIQNPFGRRRVSHSGRQKGSALMFQKFASTAFVVGTLLTGSIPVVGLARDHGGSSGGGHSSSPGRSGGGHYSGDQSFSGGSRGYSGGSHYSGGQGFVN